MNRDQLVKLCKNVAQRFVKANAPFVFVIAFPKDGDPTQMEIGLLSNLADDKKIELLTKAIVEIKTNGTGSQGAANH